MKTIQVKPEQLKKLFSELLSTEALQDNHLLDSATPMVQLEDRDLASSKYNSNNSKIKEWVEICRIPFWEPDIAVAQARSKQPDECILEDDHLFCWSKYYNNGDLILSINLKSESINQVLIKQGAIEIERITFESATSAEVTISHDRLSESKEDITVLGSDK